MALSRPPDPAAAAGGGARDAAPGGGPAAPAAGGPTSLRYAGLFEEPSGYGEAARAHFGALVAAGAPARAHPLRSSSPRLRDGAGAAFRRGLPRPYADGDEPLALLHTIPTSYQDLVRNEKGRIGVTAWDAPTLPASWAEALPLVDEVWAPSEFSAGPFRAAGARVAVVPHPVRPFDDGPSSYPGLPDDRFLFLAVFEWQARKNPLGLLRAFRRAFQGARDVALAVKHGHHFGADRPAIARALARETRGGVGPWRAPDVYALWDDLAPPLLARLFRRADAYVSLHRAEGFGLCIAQAMAAGKPVVATAYSGNLDYMNATSAFLVPGRQVPARAEPWHPFEGAMTWCEPDEGAAVEALRACAFGHAERRRRAEAGRALARERLSPERVGRLMRARLAHFAA
jgi:glycosyltransferase involved in cell wall biosynthesis